MIIIAFSGPSGVGKSTAAQITQRLISQLINPQCLRKISFADPIREMLATLGLTLNDLTQPHLKNTPHDSLSGRTPKYALESLGLWCRSLNQSFLVDRWCDRVTRSEDDIILCDDVRRPLEAAAVKDLGGTLIEIRRPEITPLTLPSEDFSFSVDNVIINDTLENLARDLEHILKGILK